MIPPTPRLYPDALILDRAPENPTAYAWVAITHGALRYAAPGVEVREIASERLDRRLDKAGASHAGRVDIELSGDTLTDDEIAELQAYDGLLFSTIYLGGIVLARVAVS